MMPSESSPKTELIQTPRLLDVRHHVAVGEHRPLGDAGGAARVLEKSEIVSPQLDRAQGLGPARQRLSEGNALRQAVTRNRLLHVADDEVDDP